MSSKRARHVPDAAAEPPSDSPEEQDEPAHKAPRADDGAAPPPLMCYLPPTCCPPHGRPTPLASTRELEAHYARVHAHVCAAPGCAKVFPDARLLELHHTECHDPLAAMRKERGEKIFRCHVATCTKVCATAKTRRLHLIEAHHYPKQYFFAITNRGIGDLIARWGESASLLRPEWKPRPGQPHGEEADAMDDAQEPATAAAPPPPPVAQRRSQPQRANPPLQRQPPPHLGMQPQARPAASSSKDAFRAPQPDSSDDDNDAAMDQDKDTSRRRTVRFADDDDDSGDDDGGEANGKASLGDGLDALAQQLSNISFVPRAVQFGRGGAHRGFEHRSAPAPAPAPAVEDGEDAEAKKKTRRTNRGGRGRSRKKNRGREDAAMAVDAGDGGA